MTAAYSGSTQQNMLYLMTADPALEIVLTLNGAICPIGRALRYAPQVKPAEANIHSKRGSAPLSSHEVCGLD